MTISRASMQQQLKENKMKKKNVGGFLESFSPVYSIAKGKGPISDALSSMGPLAGLSGIVAKEQKKRMKKSQLEKSGMAADEMPSATKMSGGGKIVSTKRTRSIDGIASKGKTRANQK